MSFLHPILLAFGLAGVALPLVIHLLFRRKQRPIKWAAMRFLEQAYKRQKRRMKLEQFLLLLARCLVVLLIALALGRPLLSGNASSGSGTRDIYLVLDDSITSATKPDHGPGIGLPSGTTTLGRAQTNAHTIIETLASASGDRVALVPLSRPDAPVPPTTNHASVTGTIDASEPTDARARWGETASTLARMMGEQVPQRTPIVVILTDPRRGAMPVDDDLTSAFSQLDTPPRVVVAGVEGPEEPNTTITSVTPARPLLVTGAGEGSTLSVRVNASRNDAQAIKEPEGVTPIRLYVLHQQIGAAPMLASTATIAWQPNQREASTTLLIPDPTGMMPENATVILRAQSPSGDALDADNTAQTIIELTTRLRVGIVAPARYAQPGSVAGFDQADWVRAALDPGVTGNHAIEAIRLDPSSIDPARLGDLDALLVVAPGSLREEAWRAIASFTKQGRLTSIFPDSGAQAQTWTDNLGIFWTADRASQITLAREPAVPDEGVQIRVPDTPSSPLLSYIDSEAEFLLSPVRVNKWLPISISPASVGASVVLETSNASPWLVEVPSGRGRLVLGASAISTEWTNLPAKPAFVPLVQELIRQGVVSNDTNASITAGDRYQPPPLTESLRAIGPTRGSASIDIRAHPSPAMLHAGAYDARDADARTLSTLIVAPDLTGTDLSPVSAQQAIEWLSAWSGDTPVTFFDPDANDVETGRSVLREALSDTEPARTIDWTLLLVAGLLAIAESLISRAFTRKPLPDTSQTGQAHGVAA